MYDLVFGEKSAYTDWHCAVSKYKISGAAYKVQEEEIPALDGVLDLSEAYGRVFFGNRTGEFTLTLLPGYDYEETKTKIANYLSGRKLEIYSGREPHYYYVGRCNVNEYSCDNYLLEIGITATIEPWKLRRDETVVSVTATSAGKTVTLSNGRMPVMPTITNTEEITLTVGSASTALSAGTHELDWILDEGDNTAMVKGSGAVTFTYRQGDL